MTYLSFPTKEELYGSAGSSSPWLVLDLSGGDEHVGLQIATALSKVLFGARIAAFLLPKATGRFLKKFREVYCTDGKLVTLFSLGFF